ncbi:lipase family protein [Gordonia sp. (in: high G+C Gram-positive bacteria)]|uniref:lipase family protein n=1 Tax=Gordonia sp. (in: high G+C Gram-positive bacteria) TaxID=84139 RepID=UPI00333EE8D2
MDVHRKDPYRPIRRNVIAVLLVVVLAASAASFTAYSTPRAEASPAIAEPLPPADAFYDKPSNLNTLAPGTIIRSRKVTTKTWQHIPMNVDAWQLAYRTSDADKRPDITVTTVIVPRGRRATKLLSYQVATDATLRTCQPSYGLTHGQPIDLTSEYGPLTFSAAGFEVAFANLALSEGWAVSLPDHGGSANTFLTPRQPGFAVLDGIRAVKNFNQLHLSLDAPVGLWGYSGGAIANSWALEMQPTYAPEIRINGAALGAPERDLAASVKSANASLLGGLIPLALASIGKDSESFRQAINEVLTSEGRNRVNETRRHCLAQNIAGNIGFDYNRYLTRDIDEVLRIPAVKAAVKERGISDAAPTAPVYVYNGVDDEVAPIAGTDKLVSAYCSRGASVTYRRESFPPILAKQIMSTHGVVIITGAGSAFAWLKKRMSNDAPALRGCDIRTVTTTATLPSSRQAIVGLLSSNIDAVLGRPLGR